VIEHTRRSELAPITIHALLVDATSWPAWSPIGRATIEHPASADGTGEIRRFETGPLTSRERVIVSDAPHSFSYRLISGLPLEDYRTDVTIAPTHQGSEITWHTEFKPRWPGSGRINKAIISRFIVATLEGLATAYR
jgi:hypothetical protein